jgi:gluconate 2-dehydrogenase subunit 3-like protein
MTSPDVAGPQTAASVTPEPLPSAAPLIFDDAQRSLLAAVLNRIVPPTASLGGAGDLGVAHTIERALATTPHLRRLFLDGLGDVAIASDTFSALTDAEQVDILERIEQRRPDFFAALVEHTYRGYYTHPVVQRAIGVDNPPQPLGHTLPVFDPAILERQRQRAPFWRSAD